MPLLHRKAFVRQRPPADLRPDEEVFLCKITHEIFRTYDEFFERTILCNSLVWSCALTGRSGLTYLEAVESERRARHSLQTLPAPLLLPLLHLAAVSHRRRLAELCEDVYIYVKDRFFPGETVEVTGRNGARMVCEVVQVHSPHSSANGMPPPPTNGHSRPQQDDAIVISDSDDDAQAFQNTPPHVNGSAAQKKKKPLSPASFKYTVRLTKDVGSEPFTVRASQISRRKSSVSRERLKLLFKQHCEPHNGAIILKPSTVSKYRLGEQTFSQFFPDEPPFIPFSPASKGGGRGSPGQSCSPLLRAAEKLQLQQQKEQMVAEDRSRLRKEKEEALEAKRKEREDRERLKEEHRRRFEDEKRRRREEKELRKLEKEKEREKLKEEKKKFAERMKLWNKPREDMECEDLKELPRPLPVKTRLPAELFGDALMVLEFLGAFGEVFDLKNEFPDGVSLEVLEEALVDSDPEGPLCELLFFFLSAIFQALDEEQEELATEQASDLTGTLDEDCDAPQWALNAGARQAWAWPQLHQGRSLTRLDLDSCTLSEILRLHILASGADSAHKKQGSVTPLDDPCVELRLAEPTLLRRLANVAVYDLNPGEKLKILQVLVGKLLTMTSCRDLIEDAVEEQKAARQELRELRAEQHRRTREEAAHRVRLRKEEKLREQEQRLKEKEEKLREGLLPANRDGPAENHPVSSSSTASARLTTSVPNTPPPPCPPTSLSPEEQQEEQEKVRQLQEKIQRAAACTCLLPLGRDRLYRRYWLLSSASALFVEEDGFGLTEDMLHPAPASQAPPTPREDEQEPAEGSAGSSPAPPHRPCGPPVERPNSWSFYSSMQEVEQLLEALNPRGLRESSLKEALQQERERLQRTLHTCDRNKYSYTDRPESSRSVPECTAAAETLMEARLRDLLLDIEDRIHQGTLGTLKVMDRHVWRSALEAGSYELLSSDVEAEPAARARDGLQEPASVRVLAAALHHIERGIERRFLKPPLGEEDTRKEQKTKKNRKKDEDQASDDGSDGGRVSRTVLERWRESLLSSSSLSQVFVHLSSLERSVLWSRSVLNARCRLCRRKGDADNMLLCDGCDRGHHTHCLRPRLKSVPEGDWFCPDCRPKQRSSRVPSRQRSSIEESEEEEEEQQEEEESSEEEEESSEEEEEGEPEEEEEEESEEEEKAAVISTKKSQALPPRGARGQQAAPRNQQATPKNTPPAKSSSRSSGKKATPLSAGKAQAQSRTRTSARLSQEVPAPSARTSTSQKAAADTAPKPVLSSSSSGSTPSGSASNRRSSGRNHGLHEMSACEQLTVELVRHPDSWPFMKLVSRAQVPDYYDIIKRPIALSTIREKVNNCDYQTAGEFVSDVDLMFSNCLQYNPRHTNEAKAGLRLQKFFISELARLGLSDRTSSPPAKRPRH